MYIVKTKKDLGVFTSLKRAHDCVKNLGYNKTYQTLQKKISNFKVESFLVGGKDKIEREYKVEVVTVYKVSANPKFLQI